MTSSRSLSARSTSSRRSAQRGPDDLSLAVSTSQSRICARASAHAAPGGAQGARERVAGSPRLLWQRGAVEWNVAASLERQHGTAEVASLRDACRAAAFRSGLAKLDRIAA